MKYEGAVSTIMSVALGLLVSPVVGFIGGIAWYAVAGLRGIGLATLVVSGAAFVIIVWKSSGLLRPTLGNVLRRLPGSVNACIGLGAAGSFLVGTFMFAGIVLLGHARPTGWNFNIILPSMGLGFVVFFVAGWTVRLESRKGQ
jgi:hypothetical protein